MTKIANEKSHRAALWMVLLGCLLLAVARFLLSGTATVIVSGLGIAYLLMAGALMLAEQDTRDMEVVARAIGSEVIESRRVKDEWEKTFKYRVLAANGKEYTVTVYRGEVLTLKEER